MTNHMELVPVVCGAVKFLEKNNDLRKLDDVEYKFDLKQQGLEVATEVLERALSRKVLQMTKNGNFVLKTVGDREEASRLARMLYGDKSRAICKRKPRKHIRKAKAKRMAKPENKPFRINLRGAAPKRQLKEIGDQLKLIKDTKLNTGRSNKGSNIQTENQLQECNPIGDSSFIYRRSSRINKGKMSDKKLEKCSVGEENTGEGDGSPKEDNKAKRKLRKRNIVTKTAEEAPTTENAMVVKKKLRRKAPKKQTDIHIPQESKLTQAEEPSEQKDIPILNSEMLGSVLGKPKGKIVKKNQEGQFQVKLNCEEQNNGRCPFNLRSRRNRVS